jgi:hypothetical protein
VGGPARHSRLIRDQFSSNCCSFRAPLLVALFLAALSLVELAEQAGRTVLAFEGTIDPADAGQTLAQALWEAGQGAVGADQRGAGADPDRAGGRRSRRRERAT